MKHASSSEQDRAMSKALFGNANFVAVAQFIGKQRGSFFVRQVASSTGLVDAVVKPIVERLLEAGVIEESPSLGGRAIRYRRRSSHPIWTFVSHLR